MGEFAIEPKNVSAIVTDTENTIGAFGKIMERDKKICWLGCLDHRLQLVTNLACKENVIKRVRDLITSVNHSTQTVEAIRAYQVLDDPNAIPVNLIQEVCTRWWTTFTTVERLLRLKKHVNKAIDEFFIHESYRLKDFEWEDLKSMVMLLEPFKMVQECMEGENYVTASSIPSVLDYIRNRLTVMKDEVEFSEDVQGLAYEMLQKFDQEFTCPDNLPGSYFEYNKKSDAKTGRRNGISVEVMVATVLDPRFKMLIGIPETDKPLIWEEMKKRCMAIPSPEKTTALDQDNDSIATNNHPKMAEYYKWLQNQSLAIGEDTSVELVTNQLDKDILVTREIASYRSEPTLAPQREPLGWWMGKEKEYPHLSQVAKNSLCILATSAPSERLFSTAGITIANER